MCFLRRTCVVAMEQKNAVITKKILSGEEKGAKRDIVLLNAGATLYVGGAASTIEAGITPCKKKQSTVEKQQGS